MKSVAIIPSRYGSTRFPGKPMALIQGKPMIYWVYRRVCLANFDLVVIATDNKEIYEYSVGFGATCMMTSPDHENGTSRCVEVARKYDAFEIVINVQGDEPLVDIAALNNLLIELKNQAQIVSLYQNISRKEAGDPNKVKVVLNHHNQALYFSRSLIPYDRVEQSYTYLKHIGVYGFNRKVLLELNSLRTSQLQLSESLEQLAWLENGYSISMIKTDAMNLGIDTPEDIEELEKAISSGELAWL